MHICRSAHTGLMDAFSLYFSDIGKVPKKAMTAKVRNYYSLEAEPTYTLLGATGVAYGWYIKKLTASHYEEKDFGAEVEEYDYNMVVDDRVGGAIRESGSAAHASYKRFGSMYHTEAH